MQMRCSSAAILCAWLAIGAPALAQSAAAPQEEHGAMQTEQRPTLAIRGFADVDFGTTDAPDVSDGFTLGQFVLHMASTLGKKVSFFGETSFSARTNTFSVEVERLIVRYDVDDHLKISMGRYHTPINYWNTAFHHGLWLQTTIRRPEMIEFGGVFQPTHFVGLLAEGNLTSPTLGLAYNVGIGNGRGSLIARAGDAGDVNGNRAWLAKLYARPAAFYGLEVGGAVYHDLITEPARPAVRELIGSAYLALSRENPEVIAEFVNVRHHDTAAILDYDNRAFYVQGAYRFARQPRWKPYYRFERTFGVDAEPVFGNVDLTLSTAGVRYELVDTASAKLEYRNSRRVSRENVNGVFVQVAVTF